MRARLVNAAWRQGPGGAGAAGERPDEALGGLGAAAGDALLPAALAWAAAPPDAAAQPASAAAACSPRTVVRVQRPCRCAALPPAGRASAARCRQQLAARDPQVLPHGLLPRRRGVPLCARRRRGRGAPAARVHAAPAPACRRRVCVRRAGLGGLCGRRAAPGAPARGGRGAGAGRRPGAPLGPGAHRAPVPADGPVAAAPLGVWRPRLWACSNRASGRGSLAACTVLRGAACAAPGLACHAVCAHIYPCASYVVSAACEPGGRHSPWQWLGAGRDDVCLCASV